MASYFDMDTDFVKLEAERIVESLQYIGTDFYDNYRILPDIYLTLSGLKLVPKVNGKIISLTPNDLYNHFIEFLPLLSLDATAWSFSLVILS